MSLGRGIPRTNVRRRPRGSVKKTCIPADACVQWNPSTIGRDRRAPRPAHAAERAGAGSSTGSRPCGDLAALQASHPMMDAVIDEIDGRMIRVGDQWLADFASCNYLGFDLDREIIDAVPGVPRRVGHAPELVAPARQPGAVRADRGAADGAARLRGLARAADDHAHPHVGDPAARGVGHDLPRRARPQDDLRRLPGRRARAAPRSSASASRIRTTSTSSCAPSATRTRLVCMDGVNCMTGNAPDLRGVRRRWHARHGALLYVDDAHGFGVIGERTRRRDVPLRHAAATASCATSARRTTTSSWSAGFSKAYSSLLAFIACPTEVKNLLKVAAPPYLYSGPSPVASLATVLAGFDVNERRGDELRARAVRSARSASSTRSTASASRRRTAPGCPIIEIPLRDHDAHRRGRALPLRPRRLRHARRLPAGAEGRGRLPRPADRGEHRRGDRPADRGARRARRPAASCGRADADPERGRLTMAMSVPPRGAVARRALERLPGASARSLTALYVFVPPFTGSGAGHEPARALARSSRSSSALRMHRPASRRRRGAVRGRLRALLPRRPLHVQLPAAAGQREVPFPSLGDAASTSSSTRR